MSKKGENAQTHTYYMSKKDSIIMRNSSWKSHNSTFSKEIKAKSHLLKVQKVEKMLDNKAGKYWNT